jgi:cytochrome b subunit of formate dehydrogenase/nitrate/TMAO reductase-like tetraheme cytochrome c subunit
MRGVGLIAAALAAALAASAALADKRPREEPVAVTKATPDSVCLDCHGEKGYAVPVGETGESRKRRLDIDVGGLRAGVHGGEKCVACHTTIARIPHAKAGRRPVDCMSCHEGLSRPKDELAAETALTRTMVGLPVAPPEPGKLERETGRYLDSIHAVPGKHDPRRPNAACADCHGKHEVFPANDKRSPTHRLNTPQTCGACHEQALKQYYGSVHGAAVKRRGDLEMAVCSDCHFAHEIAAVEQDPVKLALTENCGTCHEPELRSYRATYHGQVVRLGYAHTAKCHDCHTGHRILKSRDPQASTHVKNRLETCRECHEQATAGFVSFEPHGNTHDFKRFPAMWLTSKFMIALLGLVFLFFWGHSILWFLRERREHAAVPAPAPVFVRRFSRPVRLAHLLLAVAVMTLVLTGTTVLYADSFWAPTVMQLLGGPQVAGVIHRVAAVTFAALFFGHLAVVLIRRVVRRDRSFRWFGPDSLLPRWQDFHDFAAMMRWFFGKGPRPQFDHWTYWEKFDYWAPFWGMFVIGVSGLLLWFPAFFGGFLPGWVFNVATIVHGEEAFLAAVFLFTVHFFNSHFRPEKFPLDIVMFTGSVPLEDFRREHALEYTRLIREGRLDHFLVPPPSARLVRYSRILGFTLIGLGLGLLLLVLLGFIQNLLS